MGVGAGGAAAIAGGIGAAGSLAGGLISSSATQSAASKEAAAQMNAAQLQESQFQQTQGNLAPFLSLGQQSINPLLAQISSGRNAINTAYGNAQANLPQNLTQAQLVQTPGYQQVLAQGQAATAASAAARGLGVSGTALKSSANFATGLANQTYAQQIANQATIYNAYNQQFSNQLNAQNALYNQAFQPVTLGENAGATTGYIGQSAAGQAGANIAGAGASIGAGTQAAGNTLGSSLSGAANNPYLYLGVQNALNSGNDAGSIPGGGSGYVAGGEGGGSLYGNSV